MLHPEYQTPLPFQLPRGEWHRNGLARSMAKLRDPRPQLQRHQRGWVGRKFGPPRNPISEIRQMEENFGHYIARVGGRNL